MGRAGRGQGSWTAGIAVATERLAALGVPTGRYRMVDGSGLSRMDMLTADQLANLLVTARSQPWFDQWYAALPIAGQPDRMVGGTLRNRMRGTPAAGNVHAKTGSLTGVTALSGYVTAASGEPLVFSIMLNNYVSASPKDIEDAIAVRLAQYLGDADQQLPRLTVVPASLPADDPATAPDESGLECTWARAC
jgi:D-alanyl-D-alanine carboxypeptidase/D-alanyl-D-alanine-endopeptidase (penicillin-binding protein 4)